MSRSYKKYPILRQETEDYNYLNRQIRRDKFAEFLTPGAFKRHRPHYSTWAYRWSKEEAIEDWYRDTYTSSRFKSLDEWLNYWAKCVYRK